MPKLHKPRDGKVLHVKGGQLPFSFWPMYKSPKRYGLQSTLYALDPWAIIGDAISSRCAEELLGEARAYLEQARDFYGSAESAKITASRPLQLYYCFLNLAKALALTAGKWPSYARAYHGLREETAVNGNWPEGLSLKALRSEVGSSGTRNVFDEFLDAISGERIPPAGKTYEFKAMLSQVVHGHRLWSSASNQQERFVPVHKLCFLQDKKAKTVWLSLFLFADKLTNRELTLKRLLSESGLKDSFRAVTCPEAEEGRKLICLEQLSPRSYSGRASDVVPDLVKDLKNRLWTIAGTSHPFRQYYLYLAPVGEHQQVLPQLASVYVIMFYLGSITRYRPLYFDQIQESPFAPLVEEFISSQPRQFVYLMASEFAEQEVTRPWIV